MNTLYSFMKYREICFARIFAKFKYLGEFLVYDEHSNFGAVKKCW